MNQEPSSSPAGQPAGAADGDRRQAERRHENRRLIERSSARGLLAMLLAVIALLLSALAVWQGSRVASRFEALQIEQRRLDEDRARLQAQLGELNRRAESSAARLEELGKLPPQIAELNGSLAELRERTEAGQRPWLLAEARYLLEVANHRLNLERDTATALAAMQTADERLQNLRDPSLAAVRRTLAAEMTTLRATPQPDLDGIAARLATAEQLTAGLPVLGAIADRYRPENTEAGSTPGFARAWQLLRSSLTGMISIRRVGQDAVELVSLEEQGVRRHHLQLLLFAARIAALRGDQTGFEAGIADAQSWLTQMFDSRDAAVAGLERELQGMAATVIAPPLPDISGSLKLLQRVAPPPRTLS